MALMGTAIEKKQLQPGDLVFFNTLGRRYSHVGIYLGDNRFVHSPSSGGVVRIEKMTLAYWAKRYNGARRLDGRSEEHTSELQSLMRKSYAVFCLKKKNHKSQLQSLMRIR